MLLGGPPNERRFKGPKTAFATRLESTATRKVAMRRNTLRLLVTVAAMASVLAIASPASAATTFISLSVDESVPASTPGTIVLSSIPGCSSGTVDTVDASARPFGADGMQFRGTKVVNCDSGDTVTFTFVASYLSCDSPIDWGHWRISGGTGSLAGASGGGFLIGDYTGGSGTACDSTGITDNWIGVLRT